MRPSQLSPAGMALHRDIQLLQQLLKTDPSNTDSTAVTRLRCSLDQLSTALIEAQDEYHGYQARCEESRALYHHAHFATGLLEEKHANQKMLVKLLTCRINAASESSCAELNRRLEWAREELEASFGQMEAMKVDGRDCVARLKGDEMVVEEWKERVEGLEREREVLGRQVEEVMGRVERAREGVWRQGQRGRSRVLGRLTGKMRGVGVFEGA